MTATICRSCHSAPVLAIGLCRRCGLRSAQAERARRTRAERRQQIAERFQRRREQAAHRWQAQTEPEEAA